MDDEAHQAMLRGDEGDLTLPEIDRVVGQDVEEGIILRGRQRELEDVTDEERHHRAAASSLSLQVADIGHRHVVGKVEQLEPVGIPIQRARTESESAKLSPPVIDSFGALREAFAVREEAAIVVQIVDVDLEAAGANAVEEARRDRVTPFRYELKRRFDPEGIVEIHESRAKVSPGDSLHVVCHDGTAWRAVRPEPDKWDSIDGRRLQGQDEQLLEDTVDGSVDGPCRKGEVLPSPKVQALEVLS